MRQSVIRFTRQIAAITGRPFDAKTAAHLSSLGFKSPHWISLRGTQLLGVDVEDGAQAAKIYSTEMLVYNAAQTTDPAKVAKFVGRMEPRWAVTREPVPSSQPLLSETGDNLWLTKLHIEALGMHVKDSAKPQDISTPAQVLYTECYSIDSIEEGQKLQKVIKKYNIWRNAAFFHNAYEGLLPLLRDSMKKGFTSPLWVSTAEVDNLALAAKKNALPTSINPGDGAEYRVYNADQLKDAAPFVECLEEMAGLEILPTKKLPGHIQEEVDAFSGNTAASDYWIVLGRSGALPADSLLPVKHAITVVEKETQFHVLNISHCKPFEIVRLLEIQRVLPLPTLDGKLFQLKGDYSVYTYLQAKTIMEAILKTEKWKTHWLTKNYVKQIGATVKKGEDALAVDIDSEKLMLYSADQLVDSTHAGANLAWQCRQVSGNTGKLVPISTSRALENYARSNAFFSRFWYSYKKAKEMDAILPGARIFRTQDNRQDYGLWINASQMQPNIMEMCLKTFQNGKKGAKKSA